jgi:hypothetical protein
MSRCCAADLTRKVWVVITDGEVQQVVVRKERIDSIHRRELKEMKVFEAAQDEGGWRLY